MDKDKTRPTWSEREKRYILDHYRDLTTEQLADNLCKSVAAVRNYLVRCRLSISKVNRNILLELLRIKFTDPEYFRPTRRFYEATGINQKRWWDLYLGRKQITHSEYIKIAEHLNVTLMEAFNSRQVKLFEQEPETETAETTEK